jgi:Protein of unknown function (DUF2934)
MTRKRVSENQVVASGAAAAPARRKSASPRRVSRTAATEAATAPPSEPEIQPASLAVAVVMPAAVITPAQSFQDAVARLAYSYWEARGYQGGSPEADWLRAEQKVRATYPVR